MRCGPTVYDGMNSYELMLRTPIREVPKETWERGDVGM